LYLQVYKGDTLRPLVQDLPDLLAGFSTLNLSMVAFLDLMYIIIMLAIMGNHMRSEYHLVAMGLIDGIFGVQSINLGISFIVCLSS
jgi:hypothetical protein